MDQSFLFCGTLRRDPPFISTIIVAKMNINPLFLSRCLIWLCRVWEWDIVVMIKMLDVFAQWLMGVHLVARATTPANTTWRLPSATLGLAPRVWTHSHRHFLLAVHNYICLSLFLLNTSHSWSRQSGTNRPTLVRLGPLFVCNWRVKSSLIPVQKKGSKTEVEQFHY